MKIAGIIAEYNPFHTGHAYHIKETKAGLTTDFTICVMSGNFTQRGEAAIFDKWARAKSAVQCGADLVVELPFLYAASSAESFAFGGVSLLNALGCVDFISFGSECGDIPILTQYAKAALNETAAYKEALKEKLSGGLPYAAARAQALMQANPGLRANESILSFSNNILAIEYIKALIKTGSGIVPHTIRRAGQAYNAITPESGMFPSASALRGEIIRSGFHKDNLQAFLPPCCIDDLPGEAIDTEKLFPFLAYKLRMMQVSEIAEIHEVAEGLEHKIKEAAQHATNYNELIGMIKSKRYAHSRISRILLYALLGVTKEVMKLHRPLLMPYIRVLALRKESEALLSEISKKALCPIITSTATFTNHKMLEFDILATDIHSLLYKKTAPAGRDYTQKLIVV